MENTIENQPKKTWFKKIIIITLCLLLLLFCYTRFWIHKWITIKEYPIIEETLPSNWNGLKIVHFSDIHFGKTTNETEVEKVVKEINLTNSDIVIFSGDLLDNGINLSDKNIDFLKNTLSKITAKQKKYAILGDNDYSNKETYQTIMESAGFRILENENELIFQDGSSPILIAGISSLQKEELNITNTFKTDVSNVAYKILISHEPIIRNKLNNEVNLILCGHTLGGLIRIPKIGPIIKKDYSENFLNDTYEQNQIKMYISSGIGTENINFRFNNMPSINLYRFYNYS